MSRIIFSLFLMLLSLPLRAEVAVIDDSGEQVKLAQPAQRIVSLAPHLTEQLFAVGAGAQVVGVVEYSNYPEAATRLPKVGGYSRIDLEAVLRLKPDLVVGWSSGNDERVLERLEELGFAVYRSEPKHLGDIAREMRNLGILTGHAEQGSAQAKAFDAELKRLRAMNRDKQALKVFYEIWNRPLMTVSDKHLISDVIRLCGGENVFADLTGLTPTISEEAVITADPDLIIASGMDEARPEWLDEWRRWDRLKAVHNGQLHFIPPDLLQRATPRLLQGAAQMCVMIKDAKR